MSKSKTALQKKKYYAVRNGRKIGIYNNWHDAKIQINHYSNAQFKSFTSLADAQDYMHPDPRYSKGKKKKFKGNLYATVYTDGGCRNHGNVKGGHVHEDDKAAWAYLIEWDKGKSNYSYSGGEYGATNNRMELTAVIEAMDELINRGMNRKPIKFCLDSKYIINTVNNEWIFDWYKNDWTKSKGTIANVDLWKKFYNEYIQFSDTVFEWVKGHNGNVGNEFVDRKLNEYMDKM